MPFTVELLLCFIDAVWLNVLDMSLAARDLVPNGTEVREKRGLWDDFQLGAADSGGSRGRRGVN
jgi:hypothetical protein